MKQSIFREEIGSPIKGLVNQWLWHIPVHIFECFSILTVLLSSPAVANECVILLHGLARTDSSMEKLAKDLNKAGFLSVNIKYASTKHPIEKLAEDAIVDGLRRCPKGSKIHFVTHSMGGILVRQYLSKNTIENMGRVVMLGPPNKGSQVVDNLHKVPGFKLINGPAGMQLGTDSWEV